VEVATFQVLCLFPKITSSTFAAFTHAPDVLCRLVRSSSRMSFWPFSNSLHHFLTCCTCITPSPNPLIKWLWTWMQETQFTHKNWTTQWTSTWNKFPMSLALHINLFHEQNPSHWYLHHLLHLTPIKSATSYLKTEHLTKMLYTREPYYWTCLVTGTLLEYIYTHRHYLQHL